MCVFIHVDNRVDSKFFTQAAVSHERIFVLFQCLWGNFGLGWWGELVLGCGPQGTGWLIPTTPSPHQDSVQIFHKYLFIDLSDFSALPNNTCSSLEFPSPLLQPGADD